MSSQESAVLAERIHEASPEERYELLRQAAGAHGARRQLREAFLLLSAARGSRGGDEPPLRDPDEIALDLSRGRIFPDALADWDSVEWLLDSLAPPEEEPTTSSAATRRAMRAVVSSRPSRPRWLFWVPAFGVATAAGLFVLFLLSPATTPWAESIELTRLGQWRLNGELRSDVQRALSEGRLSESLFELPEPSSRLERDAITLGVDPPRPTFPRWEATAEAMPAFEWEGEATATSEVVLLDAERNIVWSAEIAEGNRLAYPGDQPALELGQTYYWKVNRQVGERLLASSYVGFRIMDTTERKALYIDLRASGAHPFLAGCAYDRHGLYSAAAVAFERSAQRERQREAATRALAAVRAKQGLAE